MEELERQNMEVSGDDDHDDADDDENEGEEEEEEGEEEGSMLGSYVLPSFLITHC
jgi:hypothetical protein